MEKIINERLIKRIRKIKRIENLSYKDFAYYTNDWDRDYAQCLIAQATSLEKQVEVFNLMKNKWYDKHGYWTSGTWISFNSDVVEPEWFDDFHRTLEIEEEMLTEPAAFGEVEENRTSKREPEQKSEADEPSQDVLIPDEEQLPGDFDKIVMTSHVLHLIDYSGISKGSQATNRQWAAVLHLLTGGSMHTFRQKFGNPQLSDAAKSKIEARYNAVLEDMKNKASK